MGFERIRDEGQTLGTPTGKVLGIVDTRAEFDDAVRALNSAGFDKITAICGEEGVQIMERVGTFFFSDMEERVLNRHIEELTLSSASRRRPIAWTKPSASPRNTAFVASCISA